MGALLCFVPPVYTGLSGWFESPMRTRGNQLVLEPEESDASIWTQTTWVKERIFERKIQKAKPKSHAQVEVRSHYCMSVNHKGSEIQFSLSNWCLWGLFHLWHPWNWAYRSVTTLSALTSLFSLHLFFFFIKPGFVTAGILSRDLKDQVQVYPPIYFFFPYYHSGQVI